MFLDWPLLPPEACPSSRPGPSARTHSQPPAYGQLQVRPSPEACASSRPGPAARPLAQPPAYGLLVVPATRAPPCSVLGHEWTNTGDVWHCPCLTNQCKQDTANLQCACENTHTHTHLLFIGTPPSKKEVNEVDNWLLAGHAQFHHCPEAAHFRLTFIGECGRAKHVDALFQGRLGRLAVAYLTGASCHMFLRIWHRAHGCGSKKGARNGSLVNGHRD